MLSRAFRSRAIDERRPREKVLRYADAVSGANPMHVVKPFYLQARAAAAAPFPPLATRPRCERRAAWRAAWHTTSRPRTAVQSSPPARQRLCEVAPRRLRGRRPPMHVATGTGLAPWPHLLRDWARPCHICARTALPLAAPAKGAGSPRATSAPDWVRPMHATREKYGRVRFGRNWLSLRYVDAVSFVALLPSCRAFVLASRRGRALSQPALPARRAVRRGRDVQSSWPSAAEIVVPPTLRTVIINGESDKITTADDARALQARFRSSVCAKHAPKQRSRSQQA